MPDRRPHRWSLPALVATAVVAMAGAWFLVSADGAAPAASGAAGRPVAGQAAPDFTATASDGSAVSLAALRGRAVWLTFGATWCADCRSEAPDVQDAAAAASAEVATVMVYTGDAPEVVRDYASRLGLTMTAVPDPESAVAGAYRIAGVPTHYFIDREGTVRELVVGVLTREQMDAHLAALAG